MCKRLVAFSNNFYWDDGEDRSKGLADYPCNFVICCVTGIFWGGTYWDGDWTWFLDLFRLFLEGWAGGWKAVAQQLQRMLNEVDYLDPFHQGFRPLNIGWKCHWSTFLIDLLRGGERNKDCAPILAFLDFIVAFITIDYGVLLHKLRGDEKHCVVLACLLSSGSISMVIGWGAPLPCGVPHGSVLSLLLFNIYRRFLGEVIHCH